MEFRLLVHLLSWAFAAGKMVIPVTQPETRPEILELYDAARNEFMGLKLASLPKDYAFSEESGGPMTETSSIVQTDLEYLSTLKFDASVELNAIIAFAEGHLEGSLQLQKFGSINSQTAIALLVFERTTKVVKVDLCSTDVYESLNEYSAYPQGLQPTHVVSGFRYGVRVEVAIKFQNVFSQTNGTTKAALKFEIDALVGSLTGKGGVLFNSTRFSTGIFSYANIFIDSSVSLNMPRPNSVIDIPAFYQNVRAEISKDSFQGNITGTVVETLETFSICLGMQAPTFSYPNFTPIMGVITQYALTYLEKTKKDSGSIYNDFENYKYCFGSKEQHSVTLTALRLVTDFAQLKQSYVEQLVLYRQGNLTNEKFFKVLGEINAKVLETAEKYDNGNVSFYRDKLNLLQALSTFNVECWPSALKTVILDSKDASSSVDLMLYNSSEVTFSSQIRKLNIFGVTCHSIGQTRPKKCFIIDCKFNHDVCIYSNSTAVVNLNEDWLSVYPAKQTQLDSALLYMYNRTVSSEFILKQVIGNVETLSRAAVNSKSGDYKSLLGFSGVKAYFDGLDDSSVTPLEKFINKKIRVVE